QGAAYDPKEPLPSRVEVPNPPPPSGGAASRQEVRGILEEIGLPPIKPALDQTPLEFDVLIPFDAKKLKSYKADATTQEILANPEKYPLRAAVLKVVKLLTEHFNPEKASVVLRDYFGGNNGEQGKKQVLAEQRAPAMVLAELREAKEELDKAGQARDAEP